MSLIPCIPHLVSFWLNLRCKDFRKKGLDHYELLRRLFNTGTTTEFLQISSAQPALTMMKSKNWMLLSSCKEYTSVLNPIAQVM